MKDKKLQNTDQDLVNGNAIKTDATLFEIKAVHKKGRKIKIINNCVPGQPIQLKVKQVVPFYKNKVHIYERTAGKIGHIKVEDYELAKSIQAGNCHCRFSHWFDDGEFFEAYVKLINVPEDLD
tara:strand:- start:587 stop:955 length:369 start_codon:yes stop_codon:yes gene_type:complete